MKYVKTSRLAEYAEQMSPKHPMLRHAAGSVTIIAVCTTSWNAVALSVTMLILCVVSSFVYIFEKGEYMQPMRTVVYFIPSVATVFVCGMILFGISPSIFTSLGFYLPMLAADALALEKLAIDSPFVPISQSLAEGISRWWLYAVIALPTGILRELIGSGTFFEHSVHFMEVAAINLPFAGFIMLGFGLAAAQWASNRNK